MGHTYETSNHNDYIAIYKEDIEIEENDTPILFIKVAKILELKNEDENKRGD